MININLTGIKPAYRRLIMDMSITLGQVLNFEASKPGSFQVVNVRGQVNSAYAPAQVQDFMDWLLAVSPSWTIQTIAAEVAKDDLVIEDFDISKYQSVYANSTFVKHLARMLHQGSVTILMNVVPAPGGTYKLCVEILHRHHVKVLSFVSGTVVCDINSYVLDTDALLTINDIQEMRIEPFQVAAITQRNNRTMGCVRNLNVSAVCGALIGRNGTVESTVPLIQALSFLGNSVATNLVEYGFKLGPQAALLQALNARVLDYMTQYHLKECFKAEVPYRINVKFSFLDDDRSNVASMPRNQITVWVTPMIPVDKELVIDDIDEDIDKA